MTRLADKTDLHVAKKIVAIRTEKNITQDDLGRALGMTRFQISKYESGKNRISVGSFVKIAEALGVSPQTLLP